MKKNTFLWKILLIVLVTVLICSVLTTVVFNYTARRVFSANKANELLPRAQYLAAITANYFEGYIGAADYERAVASGYYIWDASVYVFNADGELIVCPIQEESSESIEALNGYLDAVMSGESIYYPDTPGKRGVVIGEPAVSRYGNVIGCVFLVKPLREVNTAIRGLNDALMISLSGVLLLMILPVYLLSKKTADPLKQMTAAANAMARGDFSVRAHDSGSDETAQLGQALNYLSAELSRTIADLTYERNRLKAIMDGMLEGLVALDRDARVIQYNPSALRLLGGSEEGDLYPLLEQYGLTEMTNKLTDGALQSVFAVDDMMIHASVTGLCENGRMEGYILLLQDVTESVRLEQTRRDYVANVSHELRTPIASIRGLADALNDGLVKETADRQRYYGYILHEAMRLSRLIDDLLELSRLQSGIQTMEKRRTDATELIMDVAERFSSTASERGMRLKLNVEEAPVYVYTNPDRAEEVLVALLDNALTHSSNEGDVVLSMREEGGRLTVSVENPGEISKADLPHIFERFYKADRSHSGNGTGLGLSIAHEIMNAMKESLWAESRDGTVTFSFTLARFSE